MRNDQLWARCCDVLGDPALAQDPRFVTVEGRRAHHDALDERLASLTVRWDKRKLMEALQHAGVIAATLLDGAEVLADPQLAARGAFEQVRIDGVSRELPSQRYIATHCDTFEPRPAAPAARLGAHNRDVLRALGRLSEGECEALEQAGVIATEPLFALPLEEMRAAVRSPVESWLAQGQAARVRDAAGRP